MDQLDHDIVQDLLPLYHDGVCSDKSRAAVEEHLQTCQDCRKALEEMDTQLPTEKVAVDDAAAVKKISREWERGKWKARMKGAGIAEPTHSPIRGGTDGCMLTYQGLLCPNLPSAGHNAHGRFEFAPVESLKTGVQTVKQLLSPALIEAVILKKEK